MAPQLSISNIHTADLLSTYSEQHTVIPLLQMLFIFITPFLLCCKAYSEEIPAQIFYSKSLFSGLGNTKKHHYNLNIRQQGNSCMWIFGKRRNTIHVNTAEVSWRRLS